jgi:hypothetical protein
MSGQDDDRRELTRIAAARLHESITGNFTGSEAGLGQALRLLAKWRSQMLGSLIGEHTGSRVAGGPFAGMRYVEWGTEGGLAPRLLGVYESELHPFIERFAAEAFDDVVVIGCAEGYYAVGFALRVPDATVHAFDINPKAQRECRKLAAINQVSGRVRVGAAYAPALLEELRGRKALIFCDAEGAEADLMDPIRHPLLGSISALIVECHENSRPGVTRRIAEAFAPSHDVEFVPHAVGALTLPDWLQPYSHLDQLLSLWEWRESPTPWLVMTRK